LNAVKKRDDKLVKHLITSTKQFADEAMIIAAERGYYLVAKELLPYTKNDTKALIRAIETSHYNNAKILIKKGDFSIEKIKSRPDLMKTIDEWAYSDLLEIKERIYTTKIALSKIFTRCEFYTRGCRQNNFIRNKNCILV